MRMFECTEALLFPSPAIHESVVDDFHAAHDGFCSIEIGRVASRAADDRAVIAVLSVDHVTPPTAVQIICTTVAIQGIIEYRPEDRIVPLAAIHGHTRHAARAVDQVVPVAAMNV